MTFDEMQQGMKEVKDNLIVQSHLLDKLDRSMVESRRDFDERINALLKIAESHEGQIHELRASMQSLYSASRSGLIGDDCTNRIAFVIGLILGQGGRTCQRSNRDALGQWLHGG